MNENTFESSSSFDSSSTLSLKCPEVRILKRPKLSLRSLVPRRRRLSIPNLFAFRKENFKFPSFSPRKLEQRQRIETKVEEIFEEKQTPVLEPLQETNVFNYWIDKTTRDKFEEFLKKIEFMSDEKVLRKFQIFEDLPIVFFLSLYNEIRSIKAEEKKKLFKTILIIFHGMKGNYLKAIVKEFHILLFNLGRSSYKENFRLFLTCLLVEEKMLNKEESKVKATNPRNAEEVEVIKFFNNEFFPLYKKIYNESERNINKTSLVLFCFREAHEAAENLWERWVPKHQRHFQWKALTKNLEQLTPSRISSFKVSQFHQGIKLSQLKFRRKYVEIKQGRLSFDEENIALNEAKVRQIVREKHFHKVTLMIQTSKVFFFQKSKETDISEEKLFTLINFETY
eukprot:snap_masked-scaffold_2-processed-gene-23.20-mRNA-1 protein AED:0.95 eAED:1.00 QI:0/0/0/1/1/1/2/0/395